jgi:rhodanese-related sulfurtransferase
MIASNVLRGDLSLAYWDQIDKRGEALLLDVRNPDEFANGHVGGAINIPLPQLRERLNELDPQREIWVYCQVGQRAYYASRLLDLHGFQVRNITGGIKTIQTQRKLVKPGD